MASSSFVYNFTFAMFICRIIQNSLDESMQNDIDPSPTKSPPETINVARLSKDQHCCTGGISNISGSPNTASMDLFDCESYSAMPNLGEQEHWDTNGSISDTISPSLSDEDLFNYFAEDGKMSFDLAEIIEV